MIFYIVFYEGNYKTQYFILFTRHQMCDKMGVVNLSMAGLPVLKWINFNSNIDK